MELFDLRAFYQDEQMCNDDLRRSDSGFQLVEDLGDLSSQYARQEACWLKSARGFRTHSSD